MEDHVSFVVNVRYADQDDILLATDISMIATKYKGNDIRIKKGKMEVGARSSIDLLSLCPLNYATLTIVMSKDKDGLYRSAAAELRALLGGNSQQPAA